jgi:ATP-dependent RNA circularization protein (DNA/RNA ligase family)
MIGFFRFPHTPHVAWLGEGSPRDDKVLSPAEATALLRENVVVEEKLDGANLGISVGHDGNLRLQNRGQYLTAPWSGQFSRLSSWLPLHESALAEALGNHLILFGEWCTARHSIEYNSLSDWFFVFDVYDRQQGRFWSTARRNELTKRLGLSTVPTIFAGVTKVEQLKQLVFQEQSRFGPGPLEGVVIRKESPDWLEERAKLVHPDFTQAITEHWTRRGIVWNRLKPFSLDDNLS